MLYSYGESEEFVALNQFGKILLSEINANVIVALTCFAYSKNIRGNIYSVMVITWRNCAVYKKSHLFKFVLKAFILDRCVNHLFVAFF